MTTPEKSRKGRPAGAAGDDVRAELLKAARELFSTRVFKAVSVRQIADRAGVNAAMVYYYFGDKRGLYIAMVEGVIAPMSASLATLEKSHYQSIEQFITVYTQVLAHNPWWPNFVIREVLYGEPEFRDLVINRLKQYMAPRLLGIISNEIGDGHFRQDLDAGLVLLSLMGMTVFPFLAQPVIAGALDITVDENLANRLATHTTQLFLRGVIAHGSD